MKTTLAIIHETRKTLSDGTHPVKLRVTHNRKQKYYVTNVSKDTTGVSGELWSDIANIEIKGYKRKSKLLRSEILEFHNTLEEVKKVAKDIIEKLPEFTFEAFEALYFKKQSTVDLFAALEETAKEYRKEGRIKTAITYEAALKSLKEFTKKDSLLFIKVTPEFLKKYEKWMLTIGNSNTKKGIRKAVPNSKATIGFYLRNVRAAFNKAKIKEEAYPFGIGKYEIPTGRNLKKALTIQDIAKIFRYDAIEGSTRAKCRDLWLLSYLCNGANLKDLAQLKYKDINGDSIAFIRAKTSRKISRAVIVPMTVEIGRLIDRYGTTPKLSESYVLPIISKGMTPDQKRNAIDNTVRLINNQIKVIAKNIGISANVSTYTARHSFATVLKRSGASVEFISESLGHQNLNTTENYLADFEMDAKRKMAAILTNFEDTPKT